MVQSLQDAPYSAIMKKFVIALLMPIIACFASETMICNTKHFQVYETVPFKKIIVKYDDRLTSEEFDCVNQRTEIFEVDNHTALFSRCTGSGTGFNLNELSLLTVSDDSTFVGIIHKIFGKKTEQFKVYTFPNEEFFNIARDKTKIKLTDKTVGISVDGSPLAKFDIRSILKENGIHLDEDYFADFDLDQLSFGFEDLKSPRINFVIGLSKKDEAVSPHYLAELSFAVNFSVKSGTLEFSLEDPRVVF